DERLLQTQIQLLESPEPRRIGGTVRAEVAIGVCTVDVVGMDHRGRGTPRHVTKAPSEFKTPRQLVAGHGGQDVRFIERPEYIDARGVVRASHFGAAQSVRKPAEELCGDFVSEQDL